MAITQTHHAINYIEISALDLQESRTFYAKAFGWQFTAYGPEYLGIKHPDGGESGGLCQASEVLGGGPLVILYSNDLDASLAAVQSAGGEITQAPFDFPGGRRFHFKDPSGNQLAVWSEAAA